ncbi:MAG TPA: hypothetical protein VLB44_10090 [Kofleriaceae bacterium]|nr:hypothetical protein [Kofleriaceae bacterium]
MKLYFASFALLFAAAACSHDPLEPGAGSDPGTGTNTLLVEGGATAEPRVPNARNPADFSTDFNVRIQLNGVPVTTGTVTMQSQTLTVNLTFNTNNNGRWEGTAAGYDEVYRLDVISGVDEVRGVVVDGPDIHVMTAPLAGASLDSTVANDVKWDRGEGADVCSIRTNRIDRLTIADNGLYSMPPGSLEANKDTAKENNIEIRRSNQVIPAGAIGGSMMTVSVTNDVDVLALPNPLL